MPTPAPAPGEAARGAPGAVTPSLDAHHDPSLEPTVDPERVLAFAFNRTPAAAVVPDTPGPTREGVEPLTATLFRLHLTVRRGFLEKLDAARDTLSHSRPNATRADVLEAGLDLLLAAHDRRKGLTKRPRAVPPPSESDAIPAHVRRAVWTRDGGCCQWKLPSGEICGSRTRVQFDHVIPRALGGKSTIENLRLLCGPHNRLAARRILGDACVDRHAPRRKGGERAGGG